ncbi:MAG: HEAT repeat domain-containing protein [Planctomycetota bacterium]|jgi:HEAT repeat protein
MATAQLPTCFRLLVRDTNLAVDAALTECLPHLEPNAMDAALGILVKRGETTTLTNLIKQLKHFDEVTRKRIIHFAPNMSPTLRKIVRSRSHKTRLAAIDIITLSSDPRLASVLTESMTARDDEACIVAGDALSSMVEAWLERPPESRGPQVVGSMDNALDGRYLADAVEEAIDAWDSHRNTAVLDAAVGMSEFVMASVTAKAGKPRSRFATAAMRRLDTRLDARTVGFALRCLAVSELRLSAAQALAGISDRDMATEMLRSAYLLVSPRVRAGCRLIGALPWLGDANAIVAAQPALAGAVVDFLRASGLPDENKYGQLGEWMMADSGPFRSAATQALLNDHSEASTNLLQTYGTRREGFMVSTVKRELRKRNGEGAEDPVGGSSRQPAQVTTSARNDQRDSEESVRLAMQSLQHCWQEFDECNDQQRIKLAKSITTSDTATDAFLRKKLTGSRGWERSRALRMALAIGAIYRLEEQVYRLASDHDNQIRAEAVSMLSYFPGSVSLRILRRALGDSCPRVQANAIESMDAMELTDPDDATVEKLDSENNRVRANAIRSLLRLELARAGEALLDMLEDDSESHRLSALWVVEKMELGSLLRRIATMASKDPAETVRRRAGIVVGSLRNQATETASAAAPDDDFPGRVNKP